MKSEMWHIYEHECQLVLRKTPTSCFTVNRSDNLKLKKTHIYKQKGTFTCLDIQKG